MRKEIGNINAIPSKRLFLSIIADYDLNKSICELIDNTIDVWIRNKKNMTLKVEINLNSEQQIISVIDNAGGIKEEELAHVVGPGQTGNKEDDETIGIFGVGTKRAVVALAQDITITTRYDKNKTYQIYFNETWLMNDDWKLPYYEVDEITEKTTIIELKKLRYTINGSVVNYLKRHLCATYAKFLQGKNIIELYLNSEKLSPILFENWAFPPSYEPRRYVGEIITSEKEKIRVEVTAGLTRESSPAGGEYGVYFYCNDRLIVRHLKNYSVGFSPGLAGYPHPNLSLTRVIVCLQGKAKLMPWNSSKSDINISHPIFISFREWLIKVVKDYASLSRRWQGEWPERVFKHKTGAIKEIRISHFGEARTSYLPPLPKAKFRYADKVKQLNHKIAEQKPWTRGLYESLIAVDLIYNQDLEQSNRICLILLDSTLEIAFKEYLVNDSGVYYSDQQIRNIFKQRHLVHQEIQKYVRISQKVWKQINYYYDLRCKLVHERSTVGITDGDIEKFTKIVQMILGKLFKLNFSDIN